MTTSTNPITTTDTRRKVILAGLIGNIMEWFDFAIYGYFASIIGTLFFPSNNPAFFELRVVQESQTGQPKTTSIYCDGQEFSSLEYGGDALFQKVAEQIKEVRSGIEDYPIYITDIDIPPQSLGAELTSQLQTTHFLKQKQKIEDRLNCL